MSENHGDGKLTRRQLIKAGFAAGLGIVTGPVIAEGAKWIGKTLEQNTSQATEAQKQAIEQLNGLEEQIKQNPSLEQTIIYKLRTGVNGAILRSMPTPPTIDTITTAQERWEPNSDYSIPNGAILVKGGDPSGLNRETADWYFIATSRDPQTRKVTGGYFSYSGNFRSTRILPQTKD